MNLADPNQALRRGGVVSIEILQNLGLVQLVVIIGVGVTGPA